MKIMKGENKCNRHIENGIDRKERKKSENKSIKVSQRL